MWEETHPAVPLADGYFAVALGSLTPLDTVVLDGSPRYLGVKPGTAAELGSRTALLTVPYAARAAVADNAANMSLFDGITRPCANGTTQTFNGTTGAWGACPTTWNCTANPTHAGCTTAPASSDYASCRAIKDSAGFNGGDGVYVIDPDGASTGASPTQAWCLMSLSPGGWTLVQNVDTSDNHNVPYTSTFWTTASGYGAAADHHTLDYKNGVVFEKLSGTEILVEAHTEGTRLAWRSWAMPARTAMQIYATGWNTTITTSVIGGANGGDLNQYEAVVRPGGQLRANWEYGYTTSNDFARLVNDAAPALSSPNRGDDTVAGIGTIMNVSSGTNGSNWDAGYGWDGNGYSKALMGSDEVAGDPWPTTNSLGLSYDYAIYVR